MSLVLTSSLSLPTTDSPDSKSAAVELGSVELGSVDGGPGDGASAQSSVGAAALLVLGAVLVGCGGLGWLLARRRGRRPRTRERKRAVGDERARDDEQTPKTTPKTIVVVQGTEVSSAPRGGTGRDDTEVSAGQGRARRSSAGNLAVQRSRDDRSEDASAREPSSSAPPSGGGRSRSSEPRGMGFKGAVDVNAGRYSLSSHAPSDKAREGRTSSGPPHSDPIPRAPRVPTDVSPPPLDPLPPAPEGPRTQRGLGIPSPPPGPLGATHKPLTSSSRTVRGIGSLQAPDAAPLAGHPLSRTVRGIGPSEVLGTLPDPRQVGVRPAAQLPPAGSSSSGIIVGKETLKWGMAAPLFDAAGNPLASPPAHPIAAPPTTASPTSTTLVSNGPAFDTATSDGASATSPTSATLVSNTATPSAPRPDDAPPRDATSSAATSGTATSTTLTSASWPGQQTSSSSAPPPRPISVQRIRPATLPRAKLTTHLRGVGRELLDSAETSGRVVLLTAPPPDAELLARAAVELASQVSASRPGEVVLGETDFERPRLRELLNVEVPFGKGLSEQIHGVVRSAQSGPWTVMDADLGFHLLLEGRIRSPGLLWSQEFPEVVDALRRRYRLVLLIAPARPSPVDEQALRDVCDAALAISATSTSEQVRAAHWRRLEDKVIRTLRLPG